MKATILTTFLFASIVSLGPANRGWAQQLGASATRVRLRDEKPILLRSDLVSLTVSVTDPQGRSVYGLDRGAFTVLDENVRQEISYFSNEDSPASVAIVFDVSASMD